MTPLYCLLSFIAGIEARKPVISWCMRSVFTMKKRMHQLQAEINQLKKKPK